MDIFAVTFNNIKSFTSANFPPPTSHCIYQKKLLPTFLFLDLKKTTLSQKKSVIKHKAVIRLRSGGERRVMEGDCGMTEWRWRRQVWHSLNISSLVVSVLLYFLCICLRHHSLSVPCLRRSHLLSPNTSLLWSFTYTTSVQMILFFLHLFKSAQCRLIPWWIQGFRSESFEHATERRFEQIFIIYKRRLKKNPTETNWFQDKATTAAFTVRVFQASALKVERDL